MISVTCFFVCPHPRRPPSRHPRGSEPETAKLAPETRKKNSTTKRARGKGQRQRKITARRRRGPRSLLASMLLSARLCRAVPATQYRRLLRRLSRTIAMRINMVRHVIHDFDYCYSVQSGPGRRVSCVRGPSWEGVTSCVSRMSQNV